MATPASVAKHPLHPMLVVFPIGLWVFSLICDLIALAGGSAVWQNVAYYTMVGGLIGALIAAVPGLVDFFAISDPLSKGIARNHMLLNFTAVALYAINIYLRVVGEPGAPLPLFLSVAGVLVLAVSGWLGGELVYVQGVGVERAASSPERGNVRRIG
jgi:uncharacterized membrane protein